MENTRSPYRPNVRRITSPRTMRRIHWDTLTMWTAAIGISLATWAGFFHLITK